MFLQASSARLRRSRRLKRTRSKWGRKEEEKGTCSWQLTRKGFDFAVRYSQKRRRHCQSNRWADRQRSRRFSFKQACIWPVFGLLLVSVPLRISAESTQDVTGPDCLSLGIFPSFHSIALLYSHLLNKFMFRSFLYVSGRSLRVTAPARPLAENRDPCLHLSLLKMHTYLYPIPRPLRSTP
jgi:hypothetical protein